MGVKDEEIDDPLRGFPEVGHGDGMTVDLGDDRRAAFPVLRVVHDAADGRVRPARDVLAHLRILTKTP